MLKNILAVSTILSREEQKYVNGGTQHAFRVADPDGEKEKGDLCNTHGPAKNRCGAGLSCDAGHIGIGICV
ncbi:hypothetical protein [Aquimarina sp. 2201CG5-10]|uniref:hypothetical protein n=1 Tax=Aquimarina callyspongiae TaxID=3098150 RepID=UPI002AB454F4|nr:hypothetical protein [Aquimarina sp. 2201CG5-10]MDY8138848.1 hypothetical protein [Aquimarina sp. 2201CG5-10]